LYTYIQAQIDKYEKIYNADNQSTLDFRQMNNIISSSWSVFRIEQLGFNNTNEKDQWVLVNKQD